MEFTIGIECHFRDEIARRPFISQTALSNFGRAMEMKTISLWLPPRRIALFKAIIESYDNLATLRTEDPEQHGLRLFFAPEASGDVEALLEALKREFEITRFG